MSGPWEEYKKGPWDEFSKNKPKERTSLHEDFKIALGNAAGATDTAVHMLAGGLAKLFGDDESQDQIFQHLDKRLKEYNKWSNPDKKEQGVAGKVFGNVSTLPLQIATFPLSPFSTGKTAIDSGESLENARKAIGIDSLGNLVAAALPVSKGLTMGKKILSGAGMNAAQDVISKKAIQSVMDTEAGKKAFDPTWEDAFVAGMVGAGMGATFRNGDQAAKIERDKFAKLQEATKAKAAEAAKQAPVETPVTNNSRAIDEIVNSQIGGWNEPMRQRVDPMELIKAQLENQNRSDAGANADAVLARRQQELEDQVARQTSLDQNAAERARREQAPTGYAEWLAARERAAFAENPRAQYPNRGEPLPFNPEGIPDPSLGDAPRQYDSVDPRGFIADEMARPLEQQMQKTQDQDAAWAQHAQEQAREQQAQAAKDQAEAAREPLLNELEQSLRNSAYRPTGDGQGPKTRAAKASMNRGMKRGQGGGFDFELLPEAFRKFVNSWHQAGGNFSHVGVSKMLDDHPVNLTPQQRELFTSLYPETAKTYQAKIDRAWENGDPEKAARWGKRYDDALITEAVLKQFDAFGKGFKLDGPSYDAKTGFWANKTKAREDADAAINVARRGGKQSGALDMSLLDPLFAKTKALAKAVGDLGDYIPKDPDVEALLPEIRGEKDIAWKTSNNLESGGISAAMNRRSSLIMLGARIVQNAQKRGDLNIVRKVFPVEDSFRSLNKDEVKTVMDVIKAEVFMQKKFDLADLESTLSVKQLEAYNSFRKMNQETFRIQNEARVAKGKKPITELEYYAASSWQGVFKQPVRDSEGKLVWYLAGDTQRAIDKQWKALKQQFPDLVLKPEEMHRSDQNHGKSKLEKAYTTILDILDRDDPAVQAIKEAYEKMQADQTANTLGQQKHFKTKTGVRGFVGDRPDTRSAVSKFISPEGHAKNEALNYIQSQIQYSKNALMWAEMQKAGENFKKLVSDPELNQNQPNNVAYLKDYWKTNLGFGEHKVFKSIDEALRDAGVSPAAFAKAVGNTKAFFIMQKLALSPGYIASNFIQTLSILPHMVDMYNKGYKGNPIKAMAVGTPVGLVTAAQHWFGASGEKQALLATMLPGDSRFYSEAIKYAEDNGVVSRSSYDESPISTSLSTAARVGHFVGKASMSYPESVIRSITFMTAAQQLRDSGKFKNNMDLFQRAEEMVNVAMVDYRQGERPMLFAKAGTFGNALNTLQTFPANFYNQWRYFGKEALQGNPAPFLTAFALQMTLAGAMGIPGVADADKLWQFLKSKLPASLWAKVKNNEFLSDPKLWALKYMGEPAVYGALSDYSGVAMTSRMSAPSFSDMAAAPVGPISDIAGQVGSAASLAMDPMNPTKQAQAAMNSSPVGLQGLVEQKLFPEETGVEMPNGKRGVFNSRKLNDRENVYSRSNKKEFLFDTMSEQDIRNWGVRSQRETATKESLYRSKYNKQISTEKAGDVSDDFYQAIRKGNKEKAVELGKLYVDLSGQPLKNSQIVNRMKKEYIDALDRQALGIKTVEDVRRYKMLQDVLNEID